MAKVKTRYYIGQRFNFLVIISLEKIDSKKRKFFKCKCDCGNEKIIQGSLMSSGNTKSCGCYGKKIRKDKRISDNHTEVSAIIFQYKRHAKTRGLNFNLSRQDVIDIIHKNCFYCGIKPSNTMKTKNSISNGLKFSGIDRVNSSVDYTINNVVPCCKMCNYAKSNYTKEVFLEWITRAFNHQKAIATQWSPLI